MATSRKAIALGWLSLVLSALFTACGSSSSAPPPGGGDAGSDTAGTSSGASSPGGSSAAGQAPDAQAGSDSSEPVGGSGTAGGGGASANAGEPGSAGHPSAAGAGPGEPGGGGAECEVDQDCAVFNDCCECDVGAADEEHPACEKLCIQSACDARGIQAEARCRSNRCVFDLSCDHGDVTCKAAKPECPAGQIASVVDACWGPCIDVAQCQEVSDCSVCPAGMVCVQNAESPGSFSQCVEVESSCAAKPTCECADACSYSCAEVDDRISCVCLVC